MPELHSKYGASSAERWLNCPGSIQLSETVPPQPSSSAATKGTAAHKLGELALLDMGEPQTYLGKDITLDDGTKYPVDQAMIDGVEVYVDYVRQQSKLGEMFIETKFSLDFVHEDMFGTNDASIYSNVLGMLEVIDYKNGYKFVSPEENKQLAYYGLGAAHIHDLHPESQIKLTIVQPNSEGEAVRSWITTVGYLEKYAKILKKGIKATQAKNPKFKEGDWCTFCDAAAVCPKLEQRALEVAKAEFSDGAIILPEPDTLKKADLKRVLESAPMLASWVKSVEAFAFNELESGRTIEGYKLVKKRRGNRKWKASEYETKCEIQDELNLGDRSSPEWFTTPKLKSPAQLEKLVGKDLVASLCESPDTGNTMVPLSDKRPEVLSTIESDFTVISE